MSIPKINKVQLIRLLNEGKKQKDIAQYFNCTESAISIAKKAIEKETAQAAVTAGEVVVAENLHSVSSLRHRMRRLENLNNELLHYLENGKPMDAKIAQRLKGRDAWEVMLKVSAEIRAYHKMEAEFLQACAPLEALKELQEELVNFIEKECPEKLGAFRQRISQR